MHRMAMFLIFLLAAGAGSVQAQGNNRGGSRGNAPSEDRGAAPDVDIDIRLGSDDIRIIREWFGDPANLSGLPPGLAKREALPPGLQRQLQRNGTLPPGLESRVHRLPPDLEARLPGKRPGLSRIILGGNVILIEDATSLIVDLISLF